MFSKIMKLGPMGMAFHGVMYCASVGIFYIALEQGGEDLRTYTFDQVKKFPFMPDGVLPYLEAHPEKFTFLLAWLVAEITDLPRVPITLWATPKLSAWWDNRKKNKT